MPQDTPFPLHQPAELSGEWWLPEEPDAVAYGRLVYTPEGGAELRLASGADVLGPTQGVAWLQGLTVDGRPVTLRNCQTLDWSLNIPGGVAARAYVEEAFIGMHASSDAGLRMLSLSARMTSLVEWLGISGLSVSSFRGLPRGFSYAGPNPVYLPRLDGALVGCSFETIGEAKPEKTPFTLNVEQRAWLEVSPRRARRFSELRLIVDRFNRLLAFTCGMDCPLLELVGQARVRRQEMGLNRSYWTTEQVWVLESRGTQVLGPQDAARMLFRFADVQAQKGRPVLRWFRRAPELEAVTNVALNGLPSRTLDPESRFLAWVQALEAYDRYKWPKGKRGLKRRLDDLVQALPLQVRNTVPAHFSTLATETRDYLSHRIPQLEANAAKGEQLFALIRAAKLLFELTIMRELGFGQREIAEQALKENQRLVGNVRTGFLSL